MRNFSNAQKNELKHNSYYYGLKLFLNKVCQFGIIRQKGLFSEQFNVPKHRKSKSFRIDRFIFQLKTREFQVTIKDTDRNVFEIRISIDCEYKRIGF